MATLTEKDCAVCSKKTSQRCSRCKSVFFCSSACQATIWKSHKHFCKTPAPTSFYFPPLTAQEAASFAVGHSHPRTPFVLNVVTRTRMYWDEYIAKRGWWQGDRPIRASLNHPFTQCYQTLLKELQKKENCAVPEPARSYIIAAAYQWLYYSSAEPHVPEPPNAQWHMTGTDLLRFLQEVENRTGSIPDYTLTRLAPFWHQTFDLAHYLPQSNSLREGPLPRRESAPVVDEVRRGRLQFAGSGTAKLVASCARGRQ